MQLQRCLLDWDSVCCRDCAGARACTQYRLRLGFIASATAIVGVDDLRFSSRRSQHQAVAAAVRQERVQSQSPFAAAVTGTGTPRVQVPSKHE